MSTYAESYSEGWEQKILNCISLGTKKYERVLTLRQNAVKHFFWISAHMDLEGTELQNFLISFTTGK